MLQQTQAATVGPYFERFLTTFPTLQSLAKATAHDVLKHWEGLGYYRRALQLHAAAKRVVDEHAGTIPEHPDELAALPGIGRYTAGAIASIAFDSRAPILEANTERLYCRLLAWPGDPTSTESRQRLWRFAEDLLPVSGSGELNQALMDVGATVCTPRQPACERCPAELLCAARRLGLENSLPVAKSKPMIERVSEAAVVVMRRRSVLLRKCAAGERWAGLWDFLRFPLPAAARVKQHRQIAGSVRELAGIEIDSPEPLVTIKHTVTRFRITLEVFRADCRPGQRLSAALGELCWVDPQKLPEYALSRTARQIAELL